MCGYKDAELEIIPTSSEQQSFENHPALIDTNVILSNNFDRVWYRTLFRMGSHSLNNFAYQCVGAARERLHFFGQVSILFHDYYEMMHA